MSTGDGQQAFLAFRERELAQLFHWIKGGESASVIGLSNIGKSNLLQYLMDVKAQAHYLGGDASKYLFLRVNFHNLPDFKCRSVYSLILEQIEMLEPETDAGCLSPDEVTSIGKHHEAMLDADPDELKIQRFFKLAVRICLQDPGRRLVLLLDQFDRLYQKAGEQLFNNLRGLRDTYKYRVSYLVFTRDPLPDLPMDFNLPGAGTDDEGNEEDEAALPYATSAEQAREEFYELLQPNQLFLKPYETEDASRLLRSIAERKRLPLEDSWIEPLYRLTGGHAGLLRMCYSYITGDSRKDSTNLDAAVIANTEPVQQECQRLWASLNLDEQTALAAQAKKKSIVKIDPATLAKLKNKGLLTSDKKIFSPLFELFAKEQKTSLESPFTMDAGRRVVYYYGQRSERLSRSEFLMFKILYERKNQVVPYDELIRASWPNDISTAGHSLEAITANIYRIRKKLRITNEDKLIEAKAREGYILNSEVAKEPESR